MGSWEKFLQNYATGSGDAFRNPAMGRDGSMGRWMFEMGMDDWQVDDVDVGPGLDRFGGWNAKIEDLTTDRSTELGAQSRQGSPWQVFLLWAPASGSRLKPCMPCKNPVWSAWYVSCIGMGHTRYKPSIFKDWAFKYIQMKVVWILIGTKIKHRMIWRILKVSQLQHPASIGQLYIRNRNRFDIRGMSSANQNCLEILESPQPDLSSISSWFSYYGKIPALTSPISHRVFGYLAMPMASLSMPQPCSSHEACVALCGCITCVLTSRDKEDWYITCQACLKRQVVWQKTHHKHLLYNWYNFLHLTKPM